MNRSLLLTAIGVVLVALNSSLAQAPDAPRPGSKKKAGPRVTLSAELLQSIESHEGLTYATYGDRTLQLDLYRPKNTPKKPLPAIVCVHGGGWGKGERKHHAHLAKTLAHRGYVAVTISYRLSGEAQFPAQIQDCKAAVRWLRANAKKYGVDPEHIGATGLSAGGHLVALLATSNRVPELEGKGGNADQSSTIQAAVPMGAQTHFMSERNREISASKEIWQAFLGGSQTEQPKRYRLASPLTHLDANDPPVLLLSGEFDDPSTHADTFRSKMKTLGLPTGYVPVPGAPHGFINQQNHFNFCIEQTVEFFDKHLRTISAE